MRYVNFVNFTFYPNVPFCETENLLLFTQSFFAPLRKFSPKTAPLSETIEQGRHACRGRYLSFTGRLPGLISAKEKAHAMRRGHASLFIVRCSTKHHPEIPDHLRLLADLSSYRLLSSFVWFYYSEVFSISQALVLLNLLLFFSFFCLFCSFSVKKLETFFYNGNLSRSLHFVHFFSRHTWHSVI